MAPSKHLSDEVVDFIRANEKTDIAALALKKSPFPEVPMKAIVQQLYGRKVARKKFPFLVAYDQFRFPVKESLEQASSEATARYKAELMHGERFVDLTGGMGIDTYLIGQSFAETAYVEPNRELYELTSANFSHLGFSSCTTHNTTSEEFIRENTSKFDWAYIDPSRRIDGSRKTSIHNYIPNLVELLPRIVKMSKDVMIKLSPMQDIDECINVLPSVCGIWVISSNNEVKELVLHVRDDESVKDVTVVDLSNRINKEYRSGFESRGDSITYDGVKKYIYQPAPAIIKAGLQNKMANDLGIFKLHPNTQLFTSDVYFDGFFGRVFEIEHMTTLNTKQIQKFLPHKKANVISKNYPLTPDQIKRKIKIKDGGEKYLIAFTGYNESKAVAICKRLDE